MEKVLHTGFIPNNRSINCPPILSNNAIFSFHQERKKQTKSFALTRKGNFFFRDKKRERE
jgi:hypothetical protein